MNVKRYRVYDEQDGIEWYTCFDPELPRDKDDQQYVVLAADHEAELAKRDKRIAELVKFYDSQVGTPCEQIRHEQELAKYRLRWTEEKPTVEGWYWWKRGRYQELVEVRERFVKGELWMTDSEQEDGWLRLDKAYEAQWAGPIPQPSNVGATDKAGPHFREICERLTQPVAEK